MSGWRKILELDGERACVEGSTQALADAIRRGADLRVGTAFRFNEHVDTTSSNGELVRERMDFRVTYLIDDQWSAGIENLRVPVALPDGFGPRPSLSFFIYNQDGNQAIARPFLDGPRAAAADASAASREDKSIPKMQLMGAADEGSNAPSLHFIYAFDYYRFFVRERWRQVLAHDERGEVVAGSLAALRAAVDEGHEVKLGIRGLCSDLGDGPDHEVFVHVGPCYDHDDSGFLIGASQPLVRVRPSIPLIYRSGQWDFGWVMARTDGYLARWMCDPYTLAFARSASRHAIRWFIDG